MFWKGGQMHACKTRSIIVADGSHTNNDMTHMKLSPFHLLMQRWHQNYAKGVQSRTSTLIVLELLMIESLIYT